MGTLLAILSALVALLARNLRMLVVFLSGACVGTAIVSLYQDLVFGNAENYARYILGGGWTDRAITIPLALVLIAASIVSIALVNRGDR